MTFTTFFEGQKVETRRGKIGTVVRPDSPEDRTVDVQFGSKVFTMKVTQLVSARAAEKARGRRGQGPVPL